MNRISPEPGAIFNPHNYTVLIVDDEPANLTVVVEHLAACGFQIKVARTSDAGLELARQGPPDLILLDVVLPGMDGFEVCRRLKADTQTAAIPVIFMTIMTRLEDKVQGFAVGGVDYITKPFQREEVLARVTTHLRLRELTRRLEEAKMSLERRVAERTAALTQANQELQAEIAERNRAEAALKRERALIVNTMETSPVSITVVNRQGQVTFANAQAVQVLGLTKDEITQRAYNAPAWRITAFDGGPFPAEKLPFRQVMATRQPVYDVQHALEWPDGRRVLLSINGTPLLNEAGEVESVVFALQDITERKQAEEALRESESRLRTLMDHIPAEVWAMNNSLHFTMQNAASARIVGNVVGKRLEALDLSAEVKARLLEQDRQVLAGKTLHEEYQVEVAGKPVTYENIVAPIKVDDAIVGLVGMALDVTERKRAEEALQLNAERAMTLLKLNQMTGATLEDLVAFAFEAAVRLTRSKIGYLAFLNADETVLTMQVWSRGAMAECAIDDKPSHYPVAATGLWGEAVRQRRPIITNDYAAPHPWKKGYPAGHVHIVRHMNAPVIVEDKIVLVAGVGNKEDAYDETDVQQLTLLMEGMWRLIERKRAEAELRNHRDHLEELVKQRTAELAEARDRAEAANRAKSAFLTNISHELRTPLNGILGYADILKRRIGYTGDLVDGLDIIQRSGEHLLTLINDLLDLAKIEAGKLELNATAFHLPTFLRQITDVVRTRAEDKGLSLAYESRAPLPDAVLADATRLRRVLLNLLDNAVKFTDQGSVTLRVNKAPMTNGAAQNNEVAICHLRFEIADTGRGIPTDQWEHIFLPFEQAGEGRKRVEGTGLGLAISRQIVQLMGGQLQVKSTVGQGSTFWFDLALPIVAVAAVHPPAGARRIIGYEGVRRKVLVVDDKPYNRLLVADMLAPLGFEVYTASDGQDAIDQALRLRPDAIVMDLIMPFKTGLEAVQAIRQNALLHTVVIIAVSASVLEAAGKECRLAGCDEFLTKPIHAERLLEALAARLPLTWRYAKPTEPAAETLALVAPSRQDLVTVYELAHKGRIWDIRDYTTRLIQQDERYRPFAEAVQALARQFKSEQIMTFVQPFIKE